MARRKLRVVELYAGTGRSVEPYRNHADFEVALLADINIQARDAYLANHAGENYAIMDLEIASAASIARAAGGRIDILLGCPPCQGFSESGGRDAEDPRNQHIIKFGRTIRTLKPRAFAMENVPLAAVSRQFGEFRAIVEGAGYEMAAAVMNAAEYGSAQARQRLVVVGRRGRGSGLDVALPGPTHASFGDYFDYAMNEIRTYDGRDDALLGTTSSSRRAAVALSSRFFEETGPKAPIPSVNDIIGDLPLADTDEGRRMGHMAWAHGKSVLGSMATVPEGGQLDRGGRYYGAAYARLHRNGLAKTLTRYFPNAGGGRFWHPVQNRALTVREAARLQGFEDGFAFPGGAAQANAFMIGNALDRALSDASFRAMRRLL